MADHYLPTSACRTDYGKGNTTVPQTETDVGERAECVESMPEGSTSRALQSVQVIVPGQPQGKGRPRLGKRGQHARLFTPPKTVAYEGLVAHAAHQALAGALRFEGAVRVTLRLWCEIPASWTGRKRQRALDGEVRPVTKPDVDNVVKAIFDGFNGVLWRDDVQVIELAVRKSYAASPCVVVDVEALP
jgi:Holliday junction resolvase RusA-like endonuclease